MATAALHLCSRVPDTFRWVLVVVVVTSDDGGVQWVGATQASSVCPPLASCGSGEHV